MKKTKGSTRIFLVEDDPVYQKMVRYILEMDPDHEVFAFSTGQECLANLQLEPDVISLDYSLPDMSGAEVLRKIKSNNEQIEVIILSGQNDVRTAVELLREGAFDYITKDEETKERLFNTLVNVKKHLSLREEVSDLKAQLENKFEFGKYLIGNSKPMQAIFSLLEKAVRTNITVSITGETGTGKELVAKSIHYNSDRSKGPFVPVNMSAIPKDLLESELFGYEKGAFTGAHTRKKGQFELSDKGTLFLDEIAEMDLVLQAKLLRALQEREFMRLGGEKPVRFDSRIITATHRNLAEEVQKGNFREDLYYRLLGLNVQLPPLRDRGNDILLLAGNFLEQFARDNKLGEINLSKEAKEKLLQYHFPGNVRELKSIMELASVLATDQTVVAEDIRFNSPTRNSDLITRERTMEEYKSMIIHQFLEKYDNNVVLVARKLDIGKSTIYRMLKEENTTEEI